MSNPNGSEPKIWSSAVETYAEDVAARERTKGLDGQILASEIYDFLSIGKKTDAQLSFTDVDNKHLALAEEPIAHVFMGSVLEPLESKEESLEAIVVAETVEELEKLATDTLPEEKRTIDEMLVPLVEMKHMQLNVYRKPGYTEAIQWLNSLDPEVNEIIRARAISQLESERGARTPRRLRRIQLGHKDKEEFDDEIIVTTTLRINQAVQKVKEIHFGFNSDYSLTAGCKEVRELSQQYLIVSDLVSSWKKPTVIVENETHKVAGGNFTPLAHPNSIEKYEGTED